MFKFGGNIVFHPSPVCLSRCHARSSGTKGHTSFLFESGAIFFVITCGLGTQTVAVRGPTLSWSPPRNTMCLGMLTGPAIVVVGLG